jgi:hypothetical protein|tara:strand:+ start:343 stop:486 length:144 start_codon:yes stop_codon:yes gene_type:complete
MKAILGSPQEQDLETSLLDYELSHHVNFSAWKTIYSKKEENIFKKGG